MNYLFEIWGEHGFVERQKKADNSERAIEIVYYMEYDRLVQVFPNLSVTFIFLDNGHGHRLFIYVFIPFIQCVIIFSFFL